MWWKLVGVIHYILLRVASVELALRVTDVREVLPCPNLIALPGMPSLLGGWFELDGQTATVLRLDRILELPDRPPGLYAHLLRLKGVEPACLLLADEVCDVVALPPARGVPVGHTFNECVTGWVEWAGRVWHLLDKDRLLLREESFAVAEFASRAQARLAKLAPA